MFIAKYLDQKQGEARAVNQKEKLRSRLDQWLKTRPTAEEVAGRGILGRAERFRVARDVVDHFLRTRLAALEEEKARVPAGNFAYSSRIAELLGGRGADVGCSAGDEADESVAADIPVTAETLQESILLVQEHRQGSQEKLEAADVAWQRAADECLHAACSSDLSALARRTDEALQKLQEHRSSVGDSLSKVFKELHQFQGLVARLNCLQRVGSAMEKTELVRAGVSSGAAAEELPLEELEGVLSVLQEGLPQRSRAVVLQRVCSLLGPVRSSLQKALHVALASSGRWPIDQSAPNGAVDARARANALRYCADLQRMQGVADGLLRGGFLELGTALPGTLEEDVADVLWSGIALAAPLGIRFRYHFSRPESELCRMDKPEWAFKYLVDSASDHLDEIDKWTAAESNAGSLSEKRLQALKTADLSTSLVIALANEACLFVRARMPALVGPEARPTFLHTMGTLVRFHTDICAVGGAGAGAAAFLDFDANRPLASDDQGGEGEELGLGLASSGGATARAASPEMLKRGSTGGGSFMDGLAHLRPPDDGRDPAMAEGSFVGGDARSSLRHFSVTDEPAGAGSCPNAPAAAGGNEGLGLDLAFEEFSVEKVAETDGGTTAKVLLRVHGDLSKLQPATAAAGAAATPAAAAKEERTGGGPAARKAPAPASRTAAIGKGLGAAFEQLAEGMEADSTAEAVGFLDLWAEADAEEIHAQLSKRLAGSDGPAWKRKPVAPGPLDTSAQLSAPSLAGPADGPAAAELSTLLADLFDKARGRAECLSTDAGRRAYCVKVLEPGLQLAVSEVRGRWNAMEKPLEEVREVAFMVETMQEICNFLDRFSLAVHISNAADDANSLRVSMLDRVACLMEEEVRTSARRLHCEAGLFSCTVAAAMVDLSTKLRPSNLNALLQRALGKLGSFLFNHLTRNPPFDDEEEAALFVSNCSDDLGGILAQIVIPPETLTPLRPLWDACVLLGLPSDEAEELFGVLRRIVKCSPFGGRPRPDAPSDDVLFRRRDEALAPLGVQVLSVLEALAVLRKRAELASQPHDDEHAFAGVQALQLGAGALQQFGAQAARAAVSQASKAPVKSAAATLQKGAGTLQKGAGRLLSGLAPLSITAKDLM